MAFVLPMWFCALLLPEEWDYFCIENLSLRGHPVSVVFDRDGSRYGKGAGLFVTIDGVTERFASAKELSETEFITEKVK